MHSFLNVASLVLLTANGNPDECYALRFNRQSYASQHFLLL